MSTYCEISDINLAFGDKNVEKFASLDADDDATARNARLNWAIGVVSSEIDDIMRTASFRIPLVTAAEATPTSVTYLCAVGAGLMVYEANGASSFNPRTGRASHRYQYKKVWYQKTLQEMQNGTRKLDAIQ